MKFSTINQKEFLKILLVKPLLESVKQSRFTKIEQVKLIW